MKLALALWIKAGGYKLIERDNISRPAKPDCYSGVSRMGSSYPMKGM